MTESIAIIGLGHVGLPLFLTMSGVHGKAVVGVDRSAARVDQLWRCSVDEPGVKQALQDHVAQDAQKNSIQMSVQSACDAIVIAVECQDSAHLVAVAGQVLDHLKQGGVLMIASTCQPAWFGALVAFCREQGRAPGEDMYLAHVPERLMPGQAMQEVRGLPRVIGGYTRGCADRAASYYVPFMNAGVERVGLEEAALIKIAENGYRALNVVFANELEKIAHAYGMDTARVIRLANTHPRVNVHTPGAGAWGRCLPLSMDLLAEEGSALLEVARGLNDKRPSELVDRLMQRLEGVDAPVVVVAGLSYKAGLSDIRRSAGGMMVRALLERGGVAQIRVCDPVVRAADWEILRAGLESEECSKLSFFRGIVDALEGAHGVVVSVAHQEFSAIMPEQLRGVMASPGVSVGVMTW